MHDLDRVMFESETGIAGGGPHHEFLEVLGEVVAGETSQEAYESHESAQNLETYETELAAELLEVSNEEELDQFLGKLLSRAAGAARSFVRSPVGQQLGGVLKDAAKKALPIVGGAVGDWAMPGGTGQTAGTRIGLAAGNLLGLELEGLSNEDKELEVARGFVRFANAAAQSAARSYRGGPPGAVVRRAVTAAATQHAPGLLPPSGGSTPNVARRSGRWVREGDAIVIYGA